MRLSPSPSGISGRLRSRVRCWFRSNFIKGRRRMVTANDDLFTLDVINDPYTYFGHLREEDPVHWNELHAVWVLTRHDDLVWLTRHHERFSSDVLKRDPSPPSPQVYESHLGCNDYVR